MQIHGTEVTDKQKYKFNANIFHSWAQPKTYTFVTDCFCIPTPVTSVYIIQMDETGWISLTTPVPLIKTIDLSVTVIPISYEYVH